jgi:hypothetical protein
MYADNKIDSNMQAGKFPVTAATINSYPTLTATNGTVTNPDAAYDKNTGTSAVYSFGFLTPKQTYYDVYGFNTSIATFYQVAGIDVKIRYSVVFSPAASAQYRIAALVGSKQTDMQTWTATPRTVGDRTIANVREPNDGVWNWTDISNLRIHFEGKNMTSTGGGTLNNYETSISLPNSRVVIGVRGENMFDVYAFQFRINFTTALLDVGVSGSVARVTEAAAFKDSCIAQGGQTFFTVKFNNTAGTLYVSDTMQLPARRGIDDDATLVWVEFLIQSYGSSGLILWDTGMADSFTNPIVHTTTNGYFRNKYPGDVNGDKYIGSGDFSILQGAYGSSVGAPAYNREADFNMDGYIGSGDFSTLQGNYGKTFP